jgi:ABC-2 type transport system ATP-binding protein
MNENEPVIRINGLHCRYGKTEAVSGLTLNVERGRCHGLFGRNGAGKTTTIKCMMNFLRPASGEVRLFGLDPARNEVEVKKRLCFVPDQLGFHSWMRIGDYFEYLASFRDHWNIELERELVAWFDLDRTHKCLALSRGQKVQVALIGAYLEGDPEQRTVFISTHLITEFEGLIDRFTVIEKGRELTTMNTEEARSTYRCIRARFGETPPEIDTAGAISSEVFGRELSILVDGNVDTLLATVKAHDPIEVEVEALGLEEIFLASLRGEKK